MTYQVNKDEWDKLTFKLKDGAIARGVWPYLANPGAKISKIVNGKQRLVGSEPSRLVGAIGCNIDDITKVFLYLKETK